MAIGGPLALVRTGDPISIDVEKRMLELMVGQAELDRRRAEWIPAQHEYRGCYETLYVQHAMQADVGADFDFLVGCRGADVPRESH